MHEGNKAVCARDEGFPSIPRSQIFIVHGPRTWGAMMRLDDDVAAGVIIDLCSRTLREHIERANVVNHES